MKKLSQYLQLPLTKKLLLLEASFWCTVSRLMVLLLPFRWIAARLGKHQAESPAQPNQEDVPVLERISWALRNVAEYIPLGGPCMAQAIAGKIMLAMRGKSATIYLGLAKNKINDLEAHAWLRSNDRILAGGEGHQRFTVISTFAS